MTDLGWVPVALGIAHRGRLVARPLLHLLLLDRRRRTERPQRPAACTERRIPLTRVQDVRLKQGVLHRLLRMAEVQVETAGGKRGGDALRPFDGRGDALRRRSSPSAPR